jgi:hemerythrin superfamily protein
MTNFTKRMMTLENLKIVTFTDIINDYGITSEDIELFTRLVKKIETDRMYIDRTPEVEPFETIDDGEESK